MAVTNDRFQVDFIKKRIERTRVIFRAIGPPTEKFFPAYAGIGAFAPCGNAQAMNQRVVNP